MHYFEPIPIGIPENELPNAGSVLVYFDIQGKQKIKRSDNLVNHSAYIVGTSGYIPIVSGNSELIDSPMQSSGGSVMMESGNFGVGLTVPAARIHAEGLGNTSGTFALIVDSSSVTNIFYVRDDGAVSAKNGYYIDSIKVLDSTNSNLNTILWQNGGGVFPVITGGTRNTFVGNNDTGVVSTTGSFNILIGSFTNVNLSSGSQNIVLGINSGTTPSTGNNNILFGGGMSDGTVSASFGVNAFITAANQAVFGNKNIGGFFNWYFGIGQDVPSSYGYHQAINWYVTNNPGGVGEIDQDGPITVWRFNGSRGTGTGIGGSIAFAVAPPDGTGTTLNTLVDIVYINGEYGNVGIGTTTPDATAILDIVSSTGGVILPRLSTGQIDGIVSPIGGSIVYDSSFDVFKICEDDVWNVITTENRTSVNEVTYTVLLTDRSIGYTGTDGCTFSLPAANAFPPGRKLTFIDVGNNAGTNNLILDPDGADTIIGGSTISANGNTRTIETDGVSIWSNV